MLPLSSPLPQNKFKVYTQSTFDFVLWSLVHTVSEDSPLGSPSFPPVHLIPPHLVKPSPLWTIVSQMYGPFLEESCSWLPVWAPGESLTSSGSQAPQLSTLFLCLCAPTISHGAGSVRRLKFLHSSCTAARVCVDAKA